ncbi:ABC transporter substrate-binding protein [Chloroflexota bacterium]
MVACATPAPAPAPAPKPAPTPKPAPAKPEVIDPAKVLPNPMYWSSRNVGSGGYTQHLALASAIMEKYNVKIRLIPAGTAVGRLNTLRSGKANYTMVADEGYFCANAMSDFAALDQGPLQLRAILALPATCGWMAAKDANIKTAYDFKGKRACVYPGSPEQVLALKAGLAFANLSLDDVTIVESSKPVDALIEGTKFLVL